MTDEAETQLLIIRLRETTMELMGLHRELAAVRVAEARCRAEVWRQSQASSVSGAEAEARAASIDFTCDIMDLQGKIAAAREDKDFLMAALQVSEG